MISVSTLEESELAIAPLSKGGRGSTRALVALLAFVLGFATIPHRVCERDANDWLSPEPALAEPLAKGVARWTTTELQEKSFATGSERFDGEWMFGTYVMAALGFGQLALAQPNTRATQIERMTHCLAALETERLRAFDRKAWGEDAIDTLENGRGHLGYLGYAAVPYALHRRVDPASTYAAREERMIAAIEKRVMDSPIGFIETYPDEIYPVDNATALAALALHAKALGQPPSAAQVKLTAALRGAIDPQTKLLYQSVYADARMKDAPRASGTALAAYLVSYVDPELSQQLFRALEKGQFRTVLGFGAMMEYPSSKKDGKADIDSGPVVLGFGVSATGFALGASRANGDRETFTALYATAHLFGAPFDEDGVRTYTTGGPIGDAILFAMLTAPKAGR
jgi:hypothetical protein